MSDTDSRLTGITKKYRLNWTDWSYHTWATPVMLADWDYKLPPFWGAPAKAALAGEKFELKRMR